MAPRRQITYSEHPNHAARAAHAKGEKAFRTYDTSAIRPKRSPVPAIVALVVLVVALAAIIWGVISFTHGCTSSQLVEKGQTVEITVADGEGARSVGKTLVEKGLISNSNEFIDRMNKLGDSATLHPGKFTLTGGMTVDEIIQVLTTPVSAPTFTVPEGSTLQQTAKIVETASQGAITADSFISLASNASNYAGAYSFLADAGNSSLEGFLFPKTYPIDSSSTADSIIRMMLDQFATETSSLDLSVPESHGLSLYDTVTLASIVEKESDANHRAEVASVFYNRMEEGMRLQSDATVAYFVGRDPTPEDVNTENEYNTYLIDGLPPTPINSPSLACLQAVCDPADTTYLYFYFEDNGNGGLNYSFSETYEEHRSTYE